MKKIMKRKYYVLSFIIPVLMYIILLSLKRVIPNIESFFATDLRNQHLSFFNYIKNVMLGNNSIYYSYFAGMGSPMISTLVFYAISPLNILLVIIKDIQQAILSIFLLKICLSGLTMFIFLKNKFKKESYITVIFSTCYVMASYVINYYFCIFWFDSMYLAPLVLLGIDRIMDKEKINLIYIFSLSLAIICNIQMGFGLCIFSVIYYLYSFNIKYSIKKDFKKFINLGKIFLISSLCVGAISSGFILAFLTDYKNVVIARKLGGDNYSQTASIDYIIKDLFAIGNVKDTHYNEFEPLIYCGLVITLLTILYLFDKSISKKKRRNALIVILIFMISFFIKNLNIFWHLSQPIFLNYRYSIYLSLFLVMISYEYYINKDKLVRRDIIILIISVLIGLLFDLIYQKQIYLIHTIIFLILVGLLIFLVKNVSRNFEKVLCLAILVELVFNAYLSFYTNADLPFDRYASYNSFHKLYDERNFDQSYRLSYNYTYAEYFNDGFLLGKNSSNRYFSSLINGNVTNFLYRNFSMTGKNSYYVSSYDSPLLLSLLGNKYFYLLEDLDFGLYKKIDAYKIKSYDYVKKKVKNRNVYLYENPYSLSLGYVINKDVKYDKKDNLIDYQNKIIKSFSGNDKDVIREVEFGEKEYKDYCDEGLICKKYYINNKTDNKYIYFYSAPVYQFSSSYEMDVYGIYYPTLIRSAEKDFDFIFNFTSDVNKDEMFVTTYDRDNLIDSLKILQENMLTDVKVDKNVMNGKIESSKDGILFLSIPYDKNFKIYVDGKKVKYYPLLDNAFIGLDIKKGNHKIKLVNKDDNLKWYVLSSLLSFIVTMIIYNYMSKKEQ